MNKLAYELGYQIGIIKEAMKRKLKQNPILSKLTPEQREQKARQLAEYTVNRKGAPWGNSGRLRKELFEGYLRALSGIQPNSRIDGDEVYSGPVRSFGNYDIAVHVDEDGNPVGNFLV